MERKENKYWAYLGPKAANRLQTYRLMVIGYSEADALNNYDLDRSDILSILIIE